MPPKKDEKKKGAEEPLQDDGAERELVEKELAIGYLKSKLGRCVCGRERLVKRWRTYELVFNHFCGEVAA
eukprot:365042-Chlamydomonas_euryale.AAC.25